MRSTFYPIGAEAAYFMGLFTADGTITAHARGGRYIVFTLTDVYLMRFLKKFFKTTNTISLRKCPSGVKWKPQYRLQVGSVALCRELEFFGLGTRKAHRLRMPPVPHEFLPDFIRGYFDGDGNVYLKKHAAKDRRKERWVFSSRCTSCSRGFLSDLHKVLRCYGVRGGQLRAKSGSQAFELVFSHKDSIALYRLMYHNDSHPQLRRKREVFEKAYKVLRMRE